MRYIVLVFLVSCVGFSASSQSKKKVKKHQIQSREVWLTDFETGDDAYKKTEKTFNAEGELIDEKKFNILGDIVEHSSFKYDEKNQLIEEVLINTKKKKWASYKYEYNINGKMISESKFAKDQKLKYEIVYIYEGSLLIKEQHLNSKKKVSKIIKYSYNGKLKSSKTILDANGHEIERVDYKYTLNQ